MKTWWNTKVVFTAEQRWGWILWVKSNIPCPRKLWYRTRGYPSPTLTQYSCCHGNNGCLFEAGALIFIQKRRKEEWNVYFSISSYIQHYKLPLLPYIVTLFAFTLIYSIFPGSECEHTNRLFISVQFQSFLLSGKTGKTFIWISPKAHRFWNWNYPPSWL